MTPHPDRTVVVADGDPDRRSRLAAALMAVGYHVEVAEDVETCMRAVQQARPVAILVDYDLGGGDLGGGPLPLCRRLRGLPEAEDANLVVILGSGEEDLAEIVAAGADDFLEPPVRTELLLHRVRVGSWRSGSPAREHARRPRPVGGARVQHDDFLSEVTERAREARAEGRYAPLFAVDVLPAGGAAPDAYQLAEVVHERLRSAFDLAGEANLRAYLPGVRITTVNERVHALALPTMESLQDAARIGSRLRDVFADPLELAGASQSVTVSVGVTIGPVDGVEAEVLLDRAMEAAERARHEGGEQLEFYTESMGRWAFERLTLAQSLHDALANEELRVFYQPRVDTQTRRIRGMECLLRWQHPQLGLVSPAQFIPLAEETGLIVPIGEWVLRQACIQNKAWREKGLAPIRVSVNLSPVQFRRPDLYEEVIAALEETGLPADGLELEVTESMLMHDPTETIVTLQRLKRAGIYVSIDDFGTGYSSLNYLKRFPIDALKIDRSFITDITTSPDDAAITTAIILMGQSLKLGIVAEGVETESQLEFLQVLRCDEIQGYLFSPPVPADRAEAILARGLASAA